MIKQIVIINNSLGMSKGKMVRVGLMLGYLTEQVLTKKKKLMWTINQNKAVVLKADNYEELLEKLDQENIKYKSHIDAGITSVTPGSNCGCTFFCLDSQCKFLEELKLL